MKKKLPENMDYLTDFLHKTPLIHDDKLLLKTFKKHPDTMLEFPLPLDFYRSRFIKKADNPGKENAYHKYILSKSALMNYINPLPSMQSSPRGEDDPLMILYHSQFSIYGNNIDISLNNVLNYFYKTPRLDLAVKAVQGLLELDLIDSSSLPPAPGPREKAARLLSDYFQVTDYEIRIDANRVHGRPLFKALQEKGKYYQPGKTFISISSPERKTQTKNGYQLVIYDRSGKEENRGKSKKLFPYRLELRIKRKFLKADQLDLTLWDHSPGHTIKSLEKHIIKKLHYWFFDMRIMEEASRFFSYREGVPLKEAISGVINNSTLEQRINQFLERGESEESIKRFLRYHAYNQPENSHFSIM